MISLKKKGGSNEVVRSHLKHQHKKIYSICRLFANTYREHQRLFADIIAAASQSIQHKKAGDEKKDLLLRACLNMAALHSITHRLEPDTDRTIQFKSPDYQRTMLKFRESVGQVSDYEKILLFLGFEKVSPQEISNLTGLLPSKKQVSQKEQAKKTLIPYLKEKLIWS
jgi:hypothetical protein